MDTNSSAAPRPVRPSHPPLAALTGLRFIAAMTVMLYHVVPELAPASLGDAATRLIGFGYLGVPLFFVLSGFILAYTYLDVTTGTLRGSVRAFGRARVARIVPVYLFALVLALPFFLLLQVNRTHGAAAMRRIVATLVTTPLLLQSWWPTTACRWNCPAWSLSVEAFFYVLFPWIGLWLLRRARGALSAAAVLWAAGLIAPVLYLAHSPDGLARAMPTDHGAWLETLKFNPIVHVGEFLIGVCAGLMFLGRRRGESSRWLGWSALGGVIATVWMLMTSDAVPFVLLHSGVLAPLWALVIYALAAGDGPGTRLLSTRPLTRLGEASYALFLTHGPVLGYYILFVNAVVVAFPSAAAIDPRLFLAAYLLLAVGFARVVFSRLEEPARRALRGWRRDVSHETAPDVALARA